MISIRRRLLIWLLLAVLLTSLIAAAGIYGKARDEANALFDYQLKQIALSLSDQEFSQAELLGTLEQEEDYDFVIQVWGKDGVRRYYSHAHAVLPEGERQGYQDVNTQDEDWRIFTSYQRDYRVQVAQPMSVRRKLAANLALRTVAPFVLLLPVLGGLIWFVVGRGLRPLEAIVDAVKARNPDSLNPIELSLVPRELAPLVASLNDLLRRLQQAIATQREFVADAAHELRTPLTAVQLQTQLAERAKTEAERADALTNLKGGLKRCVHLVQQLLTLARQESDGENRPMDAVDLHALAQLAVADHALQAEQRGIDLGVFRGEPVTVSADQEALRVLLGNLIDNAVRHTPAGGHIDVSAWTNGSEAILEVSDTGPGIPAEELERVFDRFYRREHAGSTGSGLGLAIVRNIANRHGARIETEGKNSQGGLTIRIVLPLLAQTESA